MPCMHGVHARRVQCSVHVHSAAYRYRMPHAACRMPHAASERRGEETCHVSCYAETREAGRGARLPHVPLAVVQRLQTQDAGEAAEHLAAPEEPDEAQRREAAQLEALPRLVGGRG